MLDELRAAAIRQRAWQRLRTVVKHCKQLLSVHGEMDGLAAARGVVEGLDDLDGQALDAFIDYLGRDLSPDPAVVLQQAERYARERSSEALITLTQAVEPPRQELLRRLNRTPGGTAAILRLRRELLRRLPKQPELAAIEADFLHLLSSWFNPGFLQMQRVDWNSPAQLLEKIILHEAVHTIDGWDDLRRRLLPDRRCFAFFHPQLPGEPLIFVEVALLPEMPAAIAPLLDRHATPGRGDKFRVAAFYSISNCEPGLRGVSLGNFLIKRVAEQLQRELPRLRTFCTLSPMPGFAAWLRALPAPEALGQAMPQLRKNELGTLQEALNTVHASAAPGEEPNEATDEALLRLGAAYLLHASTTPRGDPVARFHLDNGARLERINLRGNLGRRGLEQSHGLMVNYLYDLEKIEASHARFRAGEVTRSRAVASLM